MAWNMRRAAPCKTPRPEPARTALASLSRMRTPRRSDAAHAHVLPFEIFLDAVLRSLASDPRLLDAAEGRHFGGDEPCIDPDHSVLQRFGDAPDAADIARVEIRREAKLGAIGELDD